MDLPVLTEAQLLINHDNSFKPSDKLRRWIKRISFYYPDIKKPSYDADIIELRQALIDAFDVIDTPGTKAGDLEFMMKRFIAVMMYAIGENRFRSVERVAEYDDLYKSPKYAQLVAIKYIFSHHKFQDIIYTIRPLTQEAYDDLRNRFDYVYKLEYKKAIKEEIEKYQNQLNRINELEEARKRYEVVENEVGERFDEMGFGTVFHTLTKEECVKLLKEYDDLLEAFNEAKRKADKTKSTNKNYLKSLKNKRDKASERLQSFRQEHRFKNSMDHLTHEKRVELVMKYKDVYSEYSDLHDRIQELKKETYKYDLSEKTIKQNIDKLKQAETLGRDGEDPENKIIDTEATSYKEHEEMRDEIQYLSVDDWLLKHKYDERTQFNKVKQKIEALKKGEKVILTDMNRATREKFTNEIIPVLESLVETLPVRSKVYLQFYSQFNGTITRNYDVNSFRRLVEQWKEEGFIIQYEEGVESFYITQDGNTKSRPKAWALDWFKFSTSKPGNHAPGGDFCPYILTTNDQDLIKFCREKIQLTDHIPRQDENDLLEPCLVHALCESAKNLDNQPITPRQRRILKNSLRSRCLTRFIPLNSIPILAKEFSLRITIYDKRENPLWLFSSHGGKYKWIQGRWKKQEAKIYNKIGSERSNTTDKQKEIFKYDCKICLWENHYFALEGAETLRRLISENKLKPMTYSANYIFRQELPRYEPPQAEYNKSMFMTVKETIADYNKDPHNNDSLAFEGYKQFLNYLNENDINSLSLSGIPKKFIQRSVRGGKVSIANGRQQLINDPVSGLDVNSLYPYALSLIPAPLGLPRYITSKMTLDEVKKKPVYFVEVYVKKYNRQHELDARLSEGYHVFNNYDLEYLPVEIDETKPIQGFYFENVKEEAFKPFINELYEKKLRGDTEAKNIMNQLIGMLAITPKSFTRTAQDVETIKDHPLIKSIHNNVRGAQGAKGAVYEYLRPLDYVYNYVHIYSLVLSKAKQIMEELFRECHEKGIKMFCTSTDSLYILTKDLPQLRHHLGKEIGKLKIEAQGDKACFAGYRLYAIGEEKVILPNRSGKEFIEAHAGGLGNKVAHKGSVFNEFVKKYFKNSHI